jgi:hypothetical protein
MERDGNSPLFTNSDKKVSETKIIDYTRQLSIRVHHNVEDDLPSHPKVISHINSSARTNLEFPLTWHDFSVNT